MSTSFSNCAQCQLPVKLDASLSSTSSFDLLTSAQQQQHAQALALHAQLQPRIPEHVGTQHTSRRVVAASSHRSNPAQDSFIVLPDSQQNGDRPQVGSNSIAEKKDEGKPLSSALAVSQNLHDLLASARTKTGDTTIGHPLCIDCADQLQDMMQKEVDNIKAERDRYQNYEKYVIANSPSDDELEQLKAEIREIKDEEERVQAELAEVEKEQKELDRQMRELDEEEKRLDEEEEQFWIEYSRHRTAIQQLELESATLRESYEHDLRELNKLKKTNVYNDAFCIGHEGGIATINGLRLGRLPTQQVDWPEINAAWGHTVLLTHTIARKWDVTFDTYRLIPMASFSKIEKLSDKSILELYGSGEFALGRVLLNRRFELAMVAFLDCLKQLMTAAKKRDPGLRLHFSIDKDKIGSVSIKMQFSSDDTWTRALRHVLLTLKMLLVACSDG